MLLLCSKCGIEKPNTEFYKSSWSARGFRSDCKACGLVADRAYYRANPNKKRALSKKWLADNPEKARNYDLKKNYGITLAQYNALLTSQNGVCAICQKLCTSGMALSVDHIHGTNPAIVRGLLCGNCNNALGRLKDSPQLCLAAASYLQRTKQISAPPVDSFGYMSPC